LDDLLASERSFYKTEDAVPGSPKETIRYTTPQEAQFDGDTHTTSRYGRPLNDTNATPRSVSDPVLTSKPSGGSPTSTQPPMAATAPQHRVDMARNAPRTSSIDSAISSLSGTSHSHKSSQDSSAAGSPDIGNLIQAAGSPEAVIQYLLKEKSSQAAQNAQLWRLVDKQRAMILGLNKDLERALKDKERYRKKLKDSLAQLSNPSPVESNPGVPSEVGSVSSDQGAETAKPSNVEALVSAGLRDEHTEEQSHSPIDVALAPYPITPPANPIQTPALSNMVEATHKMPSPTKHAFQQYNPDAPVAGFEAGQQQRKANEVVREIPYNASVPPSRSLPSDPPKGPPPKAPPPKAPAAPASLPPPSFTLIEASPNPDENLKQFPSPPRKAPPAPLNLGKKNDASSHLHQASGAGEESDSDYDDILEVDEIPAFTERGRRKTREDDDREREIAAMKEAELRSLSKKSIKSKSRTPKTPKEDKFSAKETMPLSPRQTIPIAPPVDLRASSDSNAGSLAGMLASSRSSDISSGPMSPPLLSPGLPVSPRPIDRQTSPLPRNPGSTNSSISPPLSPRGLSAFPGSVPLSPRAPRQPIPLPPNTPMSMASPGHPKGEPLQLVSPKPLHIAKKFPTSDSPQDDNHSPHENPSGGNGIYKGFVTEEFPDLLLPPNALPSVDVKVASSRLKPSRASMMFPKNYEEDPVFTLAVFSRVDGRELWRVEKDSASLTHLDHALKSSAFYAARIPEKYLFSGHAPAKVDARREALDTYLNEILNTQMDMTSALEICRYLSTNTMEPNAEDIPSSCSPTESPVKTGPGGRPLKNGYLTKRGKNFGGWKARFFVLDGPVFKYYESPGGPHLGTIKLQNAQIGKQQQQADHSPSRGEVDDVDNQYRHAFLILEPKRKDSSSLVRHVLCAESDKERDQWVEALLRYVDYKSDDDEDQSRHHNRADSGSSSHINGLNAKKKMYAPDRADTVREGNDDLIGVSYENTKPGNIPIGVRSKHSGTPSPPTNGHERDPMSQISQSQSMKSISAPKNAQVIQDAGAWGNKQNLFAPSAAEEKRQKKRSFFGFGSSKSRPSIDSQDAGPNDSTSNLSQLAFDQHGPIRPAFGAPLSEAVRYNHPADVPGIELPAVVYRCIEYLDAKNAAGEEGIFRLSGSNVVIKQLRERFNNEGDVNLITDDQYYDIHAVASLLKLYLRELPSTILTRELHLDFLAVTELRDLHEKISALNVLVHRLPSANNALLRYLSGFLINIINHSDTNKMTVRNVGIVFSPTLNIPAPVFALFLQQYDGIFGQEPDDHDFAAIQSVTVNAPPLTPEDIRSPRQQMFQALPTPSYDQQSFSQTQSFPQPQHYLPQQRSYDTGFTPLQPSYENQYQNFPTMAGPEYGSRASTVAGPAYEQFNGGNPAYRQYENSNGLTGKSKRRESSMFGLGLGQKKASSQKLRDERK
jgi:RalA-binding protein 1